MMNKRQLFFPKLPSELILSSQEAHWPPQALSVLWRRRRVLTTERPEMIFFMRSGESTPIEKRIVLLQRRGISFALPEEIAAEWPQLLSKKIRAWSDQISASVILYKTDSDRIRIEHVLYPSWTFKEKVSFYWHYLFRKAIIFPKIGYREWRIKASIVIGFTDQVEQDVSLDTKLNKIPEDDE